MSGYTSKGLSCGVEAKAIKKAKMLINPGERILNPKSAPEKNLLKAATDTAPPQQTQESRTENEAWEKIGLIFASNPFSTHFCTYLPQPLIMVFGSEHNVGGCQQRKNYDDA